MRNKKKDRTRCVIFGLLEILRRSLPGLDFDVEDMCKSVRYSLYIYQVMMKVPR